MNTRIRFIVIAFAILVVLTTFVVVVGNAMASPQSTEMSSTLVEPAPPPDGGTPPPPGDPMSPDFPFSGENQSHALFFYSSLSYFLLGFCGMTLILILRDRSKPQQTSSPIGGGGNIPPSLEGRRF